MASHKLKHTAISDEVTRKATLSKRIESLFKKTNELATLCDIDIAVIVQDPIENKEASWASGEKVEEKVARFSTLSAMEKGKKMTTLENYLMESVKNQYEKNKRYAKKVEEMEMAFIMKEFINKKVAIKDLDLRQTNGLINMLEDVKKMLAKKRQELDEMEQQQHQQRSPAIQVETTHKKQRTTDSSWDGNVGSSQTTHFNEGDQIDAGNNTKDDASLSSPNDNANYSVGEKKTNSLIIRI